jgi:hypothetical protein
LFTTIGDFLMPIGTIMTTFQGKNSSGKEREAIKNRKEPKPNQAGKNTQSDDTVTFTTPPKTANVQKEAYKPSPKTQSEHSSSSSEDPTAELDPPAPKRKHYQDWFHLLDPVPRSQLVTPEMEREFGYPYIVLSRELEAAKLVQKGKMTAQEFSNKYRSTDWCDKEVRLELYREAHKQGIISDEELELLKSMPSLTSDEPIPYMRNFGNHNMGDWESPGRKAYTAGYAKYLADLTKPFEPKPTR